MGVGPIPVSQIRRYLVDDLNFAVGSSAYAHAYAVLRRTDGEYLAMVNAVEKKHPGVANEVPADNAAGAKSLMTKLAQNQKNAKAAVKKKKP